MCDDDGYSKYVKWYDYFWFLIPMVGIILFYLSVRERKEKAEATK